MIYIFFVPGTFGSTVEYVLRSFTKENIGVDAGICEDGSMHSYSKQSHLTNTKEFENFFVGDVVNSVSTPIYPFADKHLPELLAIAQPYFNTTDRKILLYVDSLEYAEINMLFQYYKLNKNLDVFCGNNSHNITQWNPAYTHWSDMKPWELREWLSLFYVPWVQEWMDSYQQVDPSFLRVSSRDILHNTHDTFNRIIDFCNLTNNDLNMCEFADNWQQHQQYVLDEYNLINNVVKCTINKTNFMWEPMSIVAESIVQQKFRAQGYEIQCDGLNTFPADSQTLYKLLERR